MRARGTLRTWEIAHSGTRGPRGEAAMALLPPALSSEGRNLPVYPGQWLTLGVGPPSCHRRGVVPVSVWVQTRMHRLTPRSCSHASAVVPWSLDTVMRRCLFTMTAMFFVVAPQWPVAGLLGTRTHRLARTPQLSNPTPPGATHVSPSSHVACTGSSRPSSQNRWHTSPSRARFDF